MPTEAQQGVYPLSGPQGEPIPYDIGDPQGLFITSIANAVASAEKTLPATYDVVTIYATVDCIIGFGAGVVLTLGEDADKVDHLIVPAKTPVSIRVPNAKFKVIGCTAAGKLYVQRFRKWQSTSTQTLTGKIR